MLIKTISCHTFELFVCNKIFIERNCNSSKKIKLMNISKTNGGVLLCLLKTAHCREHLLSLKGISVFLVSNGSNKM